jgi:hypothetical protein
MKKEVFWREIFQVGSNNRDQFYEVTYAIMINELCTEPDNVSGQF